MTKILGKSQRIIIKKLIPDWNVSYYSKESCARVTNSVKRLKKNEGDTLPITTATGDVIGPANKISNLRPIQFYVPKNESNIEKKFRLEREHVQQWNEKFWVEHNLAFVKESEEFKRRKLATFDVKEKSLNAEEMSEFYKQFLDKNWKRHFVYNFDWYLKNFGLVRLAFQVKLDHFKKRIFEIFR